MTEDPGHRRNDAQKASQPPAEGPDKRRFNPFRHEEDMFKVVLGVAAFCIALILVVVIVRSIA